MAGLSDRLGLRRVSGLVARQPRDLVRLPKPSEQDGSESGYLRRALAREFPVGSLGCEAQSVSRLLYERLSTAEVAEAARLIAASPELQDLPLDTPDPGLQRHLTLHLGMWLGLDSIAEKTGLRPDQPPEAVHSMARGPLATAGGLYEADLIGDSLRSAGAQIEDIRCGLDFGCSSARVVRVLAAAFPNVRWIGCDPNEPAISWARDNLPGIEFFVSGDRPPLALEPRSLDLAFAISIWSHFEPQLGLRWFDEMHRLLRPSGHLVFTTHGPTSVAWYAANELRSPRQCEEIKEALYSRGWWYAPEFGKQGDWGVVNPAWGTSFLSPEWLLTELCPRWRVLEFAPGRNAWNQDVYVLERTDLP